MGEKKKIPLLAVVGCTGGGKTALSIALTRHMPSEIVICDSMQIYADMSIGTAKPTEEEMLLVPHHLVGYVNPLNPYCAADYVADASKAVESIYASGKMPLLCGGTGLYLDALLRGGYPNEEKQDGLVRKQLEDRLAKEGEEALYQELLSIDPVSAEATHPHNTKRVIRALEVYYLTGQTKSSRDEETQQHDSPYDALVIGLGYHQREALYQRINRRVNEMMKDGLLEETKMLFEKGVFKANQTAAQAIGYKELLGYIQGQKTLEEATEELKTATRHYAKRQQTWFRAKDYVQWVWADDESGTLKSFNEIVQEATELVKASPIHKQFLEE